MEKLMYKDLSKVFMRRRRAAMAKAVFKLTNRYLIKSAFIGRKSRIKLTYRIRKGFLYKHAGNNTMNDCLMSGRMKGTNRITRGSRMWVKTGVARDIFVGLRRAL